jgi:hypothetical protein
LINPARKWVLGVSGTFNLTLWLLPFRSSVHIHISINDFNHTNFLQTVCRLSYH